MNCPHLEQLTKLSNPYIRERLVLTDCECSVCHSKQHIPRMCVVCGVLSCGSDGKNHALSHASKYQSHTHSMSCDRLELYCYHCDSVVDNTKQFKFHKQLLRVLNENRKLISLTNLQNLESPNETDDSLGLQTPDKSSGPDKLVSSCGFKICGLRNLGNTCYMNAVVQSLCNINLFTYHFIEMADSTHTRSSGCSTSIAALKPGRGGGDSKRLRPSSSISSYCENSTITEELRKTFTSLWDCAKPVVSPHSLMTVSQKLLPGFGKNSQQDSHEFLRYLLDRLHTEALALSSSKRVRSMSNTSDKRETIVSSVFGGHLQNHLRCTVCDNVSKKDEPFFDISLDIPDGGDADLRACLTNFTQLEELGASELYHCPVCKQRQRSTKKLWIRKAPNVLCLHLKRFKCQSDERSKLETTVKFPARDLDLSECVLANNKRETRKDAGAPLYDLISVVVHHGKELNSGHFTSYAHHEGCWHYFNDQSVTNCDEATVLSSQAYILFYIKQQHRSTLKL